MIAFWSHQDLNFFEALKEWHSLAELAQKYEIHPTQIGAWKRDFLDRAEQVFEPGKKDARSKAEREKDKLLKAIGQLKVENDCLPTGKQV
ncbi:MAG: helix-turn-helix domain-containing protein [Allomuricauda sp.]